MQVTTIDLDFAKTVFQVHGINEHGQVVLLTGGWLPWPRVPGAPGPWLPGEPGRDVAAGIGPPRPA